MINTWLSRPGESFGGGFGEDGSGLTGTFIGANGEAYTTKLSSNGSSSNMLSTLSFADFYRRIILHRELAAQDQAEGRSLCDPENMNSLSLPCVNWTDMKAILYGASPNKTRFFKDRAVGGMAGGMSTILHNAITNGQPERLNALYNGRWKIFTKVGWGEVNGLPDTRWHGYACLPVFDPSSGASTVRGKEFMISVALKPMADLTTAKADVILQKAVSAVTTKLLDGTLR